MHPINEQVAEKLNEAADLLSQQQANPFRVGAYRRAAATVAGLERDLRGIIERDGLNGLIALPNVGKGIAAAIFELATTGRWGRLERLRGDLDPVRLFRTLPGLGPELASRIHDVLHVDTLEALEAAAHDGRLEAVPGIGRRRAGALKAELASLLGRVHRWPEAPPAHPPAALLLQVDHDYRRGALAGTLPTITPRRFNPDGQARIPILHTELAGWHFTALFSNTARAHELGHTQDWVVIYYYDEHHREGQHTAVTESRGPLLGQRVIRGLEQECRTHYRGA